LIDRVTAHNVLETQRQTCVDSIINSGDTYEAGEIIRQHIDNHYTQKQEDLKAAYEKVKLDVDQANAHVASCTQNVYQAKMDYDSYPDNEEYSVAYKKRCDELLEALTLSVKVKQQCDALLISLDLEIALGDTNLIAIQADLGLCLDNLKNGIVPAIAELKICIALNPEELIEKVGCILEALLGCNIIEGVWEGLDDLTDILGLNLKTSIVLKPGDLIEDVLSCHGSIIKEVLGLVTGLPCHISHIAQGPTTKRGVLGIANVNIGIYIGTNGGLNVGVDFGSAKRDIHDYQIIPETTSSASTSLAFSFIMVFVFMSFVFFK